MLAIIANFKVYVIHRPDRSIRLGQMINFQHGHNSVILSAIPPNSKHQRH